LVLSQEGAARASDLLSKMGKDDVVIADQSIEALRTGAKVVHLPIIEHAKAIDRFSAACLGMGALLKLSGMYPIESFLDALKQGQKPELAKGNIEAAKTGYDLA
jgi:Pyruvate/2-oxoacid:ferredoxin oxidoreductase gamma subunit